MVFTALSSGLNGAAATMVWLNPETNKRTLFQTVGELEGAETEAEYLTNAEVELARMKSQIRRLSNYTAVRLQSRGCCARLC